MSNDASGANARSADAGPLGNLALGLTLLAYGLLGTGLLSGTASGGAASLAHLVGGATLFIAGLWQFWNGDRFGGTAYTSLGAFWVVWAGASAVDKNTAGLFLLVWALLALTLTAASWGDGMLGRAVYGLLTVSLLLSAIGTFNGSSGLGKVSAWVATAAGLAAWYSATAALTGGRWGRLALPVK
ncbi:acetate uptake transporter [Kitasatospora cinereorecta]|uniref:Acetate uptake transporter n=1 Tax=Kitasatospora cinereorecta TaxID=285560 RepID=A0ABW0VRA7_9ACTN